MKSVTSFSNIKIILNNTFSRIVGIDEQQRAVISNFLSFFYYRNQQKIQTTFLFANDLFYTGLSSIIFNFLKSKNIAVDLIDNRKKPETLPLPIEFNGQSRYYQKVEEEMISRSRGIIKGATGSGKTAVMARFLAKLGLPSLVITNSSDMLYQLKDEFTRFLKSENPIKVGIIGDGVYDEGFITIANIQTLQKRIIPPISFSESQYIDIIQKLPKEDRETFSTYYRRFLPKIRKNGIMVEGNIKYKRSEYLTKKELLTIFDLLCKIDKMSYITSEYLKNIPCILVDEMHHSAAKTYRDVLLHSDAYYRWGFSATPIREDMDSKILTGLFGKVIQVGDETKLIEEGKLAKPYVRFVKFTDEYETNPEMDKGFIPYYQDYLVNNYFRNKLIVKLLEILSSNKRILVLVKYTSHLEILRDLVMESISRGSKLSEVKLLEFLTGKDTTKYRKEVREWFNSNANGIILCTPIFKEGIDISSLDILVDARGGKGVVQTMQGRGRTMRSFKGKDKCLILDILDNVSLLKHHSFKRYKIYQEAGDDVRIIDQDYLLNELKSFL